MNRIKPFQFLALTLLVIALLVKPTPAWACSCVPPDPPPGAFASAAAVFVGTVTTIGNAPVGWLARFPLLAKYWPHQWIPFPSSMMSDMQVEFQVQDSWKGVTTTTINVATSGSSASCGYPFAVGQDYVVYAYQVNGPLSTNLCWRTADVGSAPADLTYLNTLPKLALSPIPASSFELYVGASVCIGAIVMALLGLIQRRRHDAAQASG